MSSAVGMHVVRVDDLLVSGVAGKLASEFVCQGSVILLQGQRRVRLHRRESDGAVGLPGLSEGAVIDACDANAKGDRIRVLRRAHGHLVQDHALEVALLGLGQA